LGWTDLRQIRGPATLTIGQPRFLTDSGRLYFDTKDSLSLLDTNEGFQDVYQYEPQGVGSCDRQGGCVKMISAGHEATDSNFLAIDEGAGNVFFTTRDRLVRADHDELVDLYDARVDGGIAEADAPPLPCQGEACQPQVGAPPRPTPATSAPAGDGNLDEASRRACPKGKVRRHGRCASSRKAKKHQKRSQRHAAHHRRGSR
jgi:hypothetical protein